MTRSLGWIVDAIALVAAARRFHDAKIEAAEFAESIDTVLASEHAREIVGALLLLESSRPSKKNLRQLAGLVAQITAREEFSS